ncbi:hypothetical protein V1264_022568 [Littorina saxatilis]|uniref:Sacsin/Nov domain-containing protein n=1 Tax=Littorina saxatilis TaxID=31220 RepID=A0AAN9AKX4_9CAEN
MSGSGTWPDPDDPRCKMADDDRDVGGHSKRVLGFERPSLLEDLKNIMHEYPDNEHIFKEMLQNAEDARATTVKIVSVPRDATPPPPVKTPRQSDPTSWRPPFARVFSVSAEFLS